MQSVKTPGLFGLCLSFQHCLTEDAGSWWGLFSLEADRRVPLDLHEKVKCFCKKPPVKSSYSEEAGNPLLPQYNTGISMEAWGLSEDGVRRRSLVYQVCMFLKLSGKYLK